MFVPGQMIFFTYKPKYLALSTNFNLSESRCMEKLSNWGDWSWNLLPIITTLDFLLLIERQLFEYHLVIEFIRVSSLCFSSSTLSADAYMITSSASILRTHPSNVKLEISLMNSKNKMGLSTDHCDTPFLYPDIQMFLFETKQAVDGCDDNF